ncbi:MAG: tetratricopeptide repeat protein [Flavobacteriaceae bacterium]
MKARFLLALLWLSYANIHGQNPMQPGFEMLEKGAFQDAKEFFGEYLKDHPDNKTAKICYGRAVGLSGSPETATGLFAELLETYPNDFEVQINYNESFLWNSEFETAKPLYEKLVADHPDKFGALLGYANTLSNLKEYPKALEWVNKALALQPDNQSAKVSRKYIKLGYANNLSQLQAYDRGKALLKEITHDFPNDRDALLNLANMHLITKSTDSAKAIYRQLATSAKDSVFALNQTALADHIAEDDKTALKIAQQAKKKAETLGDKELQLKAHERYVQALIWNRKFKLAKKNITHLEKTHVDHATVLALKATLGMYTGDSKKSVEHYNAILKKDQKSFDGNLGSANALYASDRIIDSYRAVYQTLSIYDQQKDALSLLEKLNQGFLPEVNEHAAHTFDNGDNIGYFSTTEIKLPLSTKFTASAAYQYRTTENDVTVHQASSNLFEAGMAYRLLPKTSLKASLGIYDANAGEDSYSQPIVTAQLVTQPYKLQHLEIGYKQEVQSFNAELIKRQIVMHHYGINYNLGTTFNLGWYTQFIHTQQNDANTRDLLFTSLYYNLTRKPALKVGVNYQYFQFKEQLPTVYFSPSKYHAVEVFGDVRGSISKNTKGMLTVASGFQEVEEDPQTFIYRFEAGLEHAFSKRLTASLYGKHNSLASVVSAGFKYTELGFKIKWDMAPKPVFNKKLQETIASR